MGNFYARQHGKMKHWSKRRSRSKMAENDADIDDAGCSMKVSPTRFLVIIKYQGESNRNRLERGQNKEEEQQQKKE